MRVFSDIDEVRERLVVSFVGEVTLYDITEMVSTSGKARVLHYPLLVDARRAHFEISAHDTDKFQKLVKELSYQSRLGSTAVLVADMRDIAVVKKLADLAQPHCRVEAFMEQNQAEAWLGWTTPAQLSEIVPSSSPRPAPALRA